MGAAECTLFFSKIKYAPDTRKNETRDIKRNTTVMFIYSMLSKWMVAKIDMYTVKRYAAKTEPM